MRSSTAASRVVRLLNEQQNRLRSVPHELLPNAAEMAVEVGVHEKSVLWFGDHNGDGIVPARDQASGGLVGYIAELGHRFSDALGDRRPHPWLAVDHTRHGGLRHPCRARHVFECGALSVHAFSQLCLRLGAVHRLHVNPWPAAPVPFGLALRCALIGVPAPFCTTGCAASSGSVASATKPRKTRSPGHGVLSGIERDPRLPNPFTLGVNDCAQATATRTRWRQSW